MLSILLFFICVVVLFVEYFQNKLEYGENVVSFYGAIVLNIQVETFYHLAKRFDVIARYGGIVMFTTF